jgi:putative GTP pyrophosphokinase
MNKQTSQQQRLLPSRDEFCRAYNITAKERLGVAEKEWSTLEEICAEYQSRASEFESTGSSIADRLKSLKQMHSLKVRVKDPEHLIEKIIRKRAERDVPISVENYDQVITDLVGIRVLHLFKDDWHAIHDFVMSTWECFEKPVAYIRAGDPEDHQKAFAQAGCEVREHPAGYRSIHYVIVSSPTKTTYRAELQVRTIFEEAWSEIDHQIRYPYFMEDPVLSQFLELFNRAAGNADEMGTFIKNLKFVMDRQKEEANVKEKALRKTISELDLAKQQKEKLEKQVADLRKPNATQLPTFRGVESAYEGITSSLLSRGILNVLNPAGKECKRCGKPFVDFVAIGDPDLCPDCRRISFVKSL